MTAQVLFPPAPIFPTQPANSNKQEYYGKAGKFFDFWRDEISQKAGDSLDREWVNTSMTYCDFGLDAVSRQAPDEVVIFARQLNFCLMLGQERGIFQTST